MDAGLILVSRFSCEREFFVFSVSFRFDKTLNTPVAQLWNNLSYRVQTVSCETMASKKEIRAGRLSPMIALSPEQSSRAVLTPSSKELHHLHLRGGIEVPTPSEQRQQTTHKIHQSTRGDMLYDHSREDLIAGMSLLPQKEEELRTEKFNCRSRRYEPVTLYHGGQTVPKSEQLQQTIVQAKRDREHTLHCSEWVSSLRTRAAGSRDGVSTAAGDGSVSRPVPKSDDVTVVSAADILQQLQVISGSRAFCSAEQFETVIENFGLSFSNPLVASITRLCPISAEAVVNFTPLYGICESFMGTSQSPLAAGESASFASQHAAESSNSINPTPTQSVNLFPVHNFDQTPIPGADNSAPSGNDESSAPENDRTRVTLVVEF